MKSSLKNVEAKIDGIKSFVHVVTQRVDAALDCRETLSLRIKLSGNAIPQIEDSSH